MTVRRKEILQDGLVGTIFIISGLILIFRLKAMYISIGVIYYIGAIIIIITDRIKIKSEDRISEYNIKKAESTVFRFIIMGLIGCILILAFKKPIVFDLKAYLPFIVGAALLSKLICFLIYEKNAQGD